MTAAMFDMVRDVDVTGISGTGPVGTVVEFDNGDTVLHWDSATPSTNVYRDIRHIEALHGHGGATRLVPHETRLEAAYRLVMPYLLNGYGYRPHTVTPHPDHPDRLLLAFHNGDERAWSFWIALFDGSTDDSVHEEVNGEMQHRWVSPDGLLWLIYHSPLADEPTDPPWSAFERPDHPLDTFDREDR